LPGYVSLIGNEKVRPVSKCPFADSTFQTGLKCRFVYDFAIVNDVYMTIATLMDGKVAARGFT
jgi:hypothetical protein